MEVMWADRMRTKWEKEGWEKGEKEGEKKGLIDGKREGKRETLLRLLTKKYGPLSEEVTTRVRSLESVDELDAYLDRVLTATSLEEMELGARE